MNRGVRRLDALATSAGRLEAASDLSVLAFRGRLGVLGMLGSELVGVSIQLSFGSASASLLVAWKRC